MSHRCHWPNCKTDVEARFWGCLLHWSRLPADIKRGIWLHYRPGQEIDKKPSAEYVDIALKAREWALAWEQEHGKAEYVCRWPGCNVEIDSKYWGCVRHLLLLPLHIKQELWKNYHDERPGSKVQFPRRYRYKQALAEAHKFAEAWEAGQAPAKDGT